jgi:hypothetical protein
MNTETKTKEVDATGVYFRRTLHDGDGALVSDERMKCDPVLMFVQPQPVTLDAASVVVDIHFALQDFDGEARTDSGEIQFRLFDREVAGDEGVPFVRQLVNGELTLSLEFDAPGQYVLTVEPPLLVDMQLVEPLRLKVL